MRPGKTYRRHNSFTEEEIETIWKVRHLPTKDVLHLFPGRSIPVISYLRAKTGAYRIFPRDMPKCPECGASALRPKCAFELGGDCPRHQVAMRWRQTQRLQQEGQYSGEEAKISIY